MKQKDFSVSVEMERSTQDVFTTITENVSQWWGFKDYSGSSAKLNDEFIINHPGAHYSKQKVIEVIPNKRVVWLVTESCLDWLEKDKGEWTNTKMVFEIVEKGDKTELHFTHVGLVPGMGCYEMCSQGWNIVIRQWLFNFIAG